MSDVKNGIAKLASDIVSDFQGDDNSATVTQDTQRPRTPKETQEIQRNPARSADADVFPAEPGEVERSSRRSKRKERGDWFAEVAARPFDEFLVAAYQYWRGAEPVGEEWYSDLYWFVWLLRGHGTVQTWLEHPEKVIPLVEKHLKGWTQARKRQGAIPEFGFHGDPWFEWFGVEKADARAEFADVWMRARYLPGHSPLNQARDEARRTRLLIPEEKRGLRAVSPQGERDEKDYEFFISIAGHLQVAMGAQPIKLPCQAMAELMDVSKMTISRYRKWAVEDNLISVVKDHAFRSRGKSDATEFKFDVGQYSCLKEKAQ